MSLPSSSPNGVRSTSRATAREERFGSNGFMDQVFLVRIGHCAISVFFLQLAVLQCGQALPHFGQHVRVDLAADHALALGKLPQDLAPGTDQHAVAEGAAAVAVGAAL